MLDRARVVFFIIIIIISILQVTIHELIIII